MEIKSARKQPRAALFDLDGVLLDTESLYTTFWSDVNRRFPTGVDNFALVIKGNTLGTILDTYFTDTTAREAILAMLVEFERNLQYRLFQGISGMLKALHNAGVGIAVVTSSSLKKMGEVFRAIPELKPLIDTLVTEQDVTHSKPHPEGYLLAAHRLGTDPRHCIVVEDSFAGLAAGRAAGCRVVGIASTNPRASLAGKADVILDTAADVTAALIP